MAFFKKLKARLFTLEPHRKQNNLAKQTSLQSAQLSSKKSSQTQQDAQLQLQKAQTKQAQKLLKLRQKQRIKAKRTDKYVAGMQKSGSSFAHHLKELQARHNHLDETYFEELEEILITADISLHFVLEIIDAIRKEVQLENITDLSLINEIVADKMFVIYTNQSYVDTRLNLKANRTNIFLIVGVNGSGKTTSIAKLAYKFQNEGQKVLIVAADTFRAGAVQQLAVWAQRVGCEIVKPARHGADPASVVYAALERIDQQPYDVVLIDTAGRLQNKTNLMNELAKINRIISRKFHDAPHESLLVLDATTGQNGVLQAKAFQTVTPISGIILTKMDGTSKGGIVLTIKDQLKLAVKLIGLGEQLDDLQEFDLDAFIYGLTKELIDV